MLYEIPNTKFSRSLVTSVNLISQCFIFHQIDIACCCVRDIEFIIINCQTTTASRNLFIFSMALQCDFKIGVLP